MANDGKANGEQGGKTGEANNQQVEMVAKAEYEKIISENENLRKGKTDTEKELENAKLELLSPDYINYLESRNKGNEEVSDRLTGTDFDKMNRAELVNFIKNDLGVVVKEIREKEIAPMRTILNDLKAREEVRLCKERYPDFEEYRTDMIKLVQERERSVEDAYKLAKQNRKIEKDQKEKETAARAASEKPGGSAANTSEPKSFKSKKDAADDAWAKVVGDKETL